MRGGRGDPCLHSPSRLRGMPGNPAAPDFRQTRRCGFLDKTLAKNRRQDSCRARPDNQTTARHTHPADDPIKSASHCITDRIEDMAGQRPPNSARLQVHPQSAITAPVRPSEGQSRQRRRSTGGPSFGQRRTRRFAGRSARRPDAALSRHVSIRELFAPALQGFRHQAAPPAVTGAPRARGLAAICKSSFPAGGHAPPGVGRRRSPHVVRALTPPSEAGTVRGSSGTQRQTVRLIDGRNALVDFSEYVESINQLAKPGATISPLRWRTELSAMSRWRTQSDPPPSRESG